MQTPWRSATPPPRPSCPRACPLRCSCCTMRTSAPLERRSWTKNASPGATSTGCCLDLEPRVVGDALATPVQSGLLAVYSYASLKKDDRLPVLDALKVKKTVSAMNRQVALSEQCVHDKDRVACRFIDEAKQRAHRRREAARSNASLTWCVSPIRTASCPSRTTSTSKTAPSCTWRSAASRSSPTLTRSSIWRCCGSMTTRCVALLLNRIHLGMELTMFARRVSDRSLGRTGPVLPHQEPPRAQQPHSVRPE